MSRVTVILESTDATNFNTGFFLWATSGSAVMLEKTPNKNLLETFGILEYCWKHLVFVPTCEQKYVVFRYAKIS